MLIVCPNCATSYQVEPSSLAPAGRSVRCVRCRNTWFVPNTALMASIAAAHREDVARLTTAAAGSDPVEPQAADPDSDMAPPSSLPPDPPQDGEPAKPGDNYGWNVSLPQGPVAEDPPPGAEPAPTDEPVAVAHDAPSLAPPDPGEAAPAVEPPPSEDIETVAARRVRRPARRRSRTPILGWPTAILALIAVNAGLIAWRTDVVRVMPQMASLYSAIGLPVNLRGLTFTDIVTRREAQEGVQVLVVEGFIRNETRRVAQVPRLRFAVRNTAGQEIYSWTAVPARTSIPSGTMLPFRSRLASPPPEAHEVLVRFFNKRDLVAGIQ
jgi:predicted Zn finger-like uncharacterized protein